MPVGDNISALADWVELRVAGQGESLSLAQLNRLLKAEGSELADEELGDGQLVGDGEVELDLPEEQAVDADIDVRIEEIRDEIRQRADLGTKIYPFLVEAERVRQREVCGCNVYLLLLALGNGDLPFRPDRRAHEVEEAYDLIALEALRRYLGRGSHGVRFARTGRADDPTADEDPLEADPERRPTEFPKAIRWLRAKLDLGPGVRSPSDEDALAEAEETQTHWEDEGQTEEGLGRPLLASYNDGGVDVVVWWKFADARAGFPVLLAQCTVQLAWERKLNDIDLIMWEKWIDFDTVPPQRAVVIPFADPRDSQLWRDRTSKAGIILDRIRMVELLEELDCGTLEALTDDRVRAWTRTELQAA